MILDKLFQSTNGWAWNKSKNWTTGWSLGSWEGVTLDASFGISNLDLSNNNLEGEYHHLMGLFSVGYRDY